VTTSPARVAAPRPPDLPPPHRFPVVATVAPLIVSAVLFAITRSPFTLMFAVLGPVIAAASTVDAGFHRRRTRRSEAKRFETDAARITDAIDAAHANERRGGVGTAAVQELLDRPELIFSRWQEPAVTPIPVRVGSGELPSTLSYDAPMTATSARDASVSSRLTELRERAIILNDAPIVASLKSGIRIEGPSVPVAAAARAIVLQLAAALSPENWSLVVPSTAEDWLASLPHVVERSAESAEVRFTGEDRDIRVAIGSATSGRMTELDEALEISAGGAARMGTSILRPDFVGTEEAGEAARSIAVLAGRAKLRRIAPSSLPEAIGLAALEGDQSETAGLTTTVGIGAEAPLDVDLVAHGPHAIVGGTTGSGKSELLLSWVLGMAAKRSPSEVTFLFVDFKGGASFGSLLKLPHAVGVITDLDAEQALRALASLTAELRHRERELAAAGLRGIDLADRVPFPRLVVVVDEYAALVETFPTLHDVFADIAARGRSLGVHLILCTQRPAGVVRDGILANCALRISLRVTSAVDSAAVLGTDAAASLPARPVGRAFMSIGGGPAIPFQVALSAESDVERVIGRWTGAALPRVPWLPPLTSHLTLDALRLAALPGNGKDAVTFALADLPSEQTQRPVAYRPREHGPLLVVGAAGSGKSGTVAALAACASGYRVRLVPTGLPALWDFVTTALGGPRGDDQIVLLDDIDSAIAGCQETYQAALVEALARLLRDGPGLGLYPVLTAQRIGGAMHGLAALCGSQLILRMPSRAEHAMVGGDSAEYVAHLPPGAGHWNGLRIQIAEAAGPVSMPAAPRSAAIDVTTARVAVVSSHPERFAATLGELAGNRRIMPLAPVGFGSRSDELEIVRGDSSPILIADPDLWQSQWSLFGTLQRSYNILFDGCSVAEFRALTRSRDLPPPFPTGTRSLWLRTPEGEVSRARLGED
jgi:S-DNA-T family DNA segregation ATPase FtsK/SpoIIIE